MNAVPPVSLLETYPYDSRQKGEAQENGSEEDGGGIRRKSRGKGECTGQVKKFISCGSQVLIELGPKTSLVRPPTNNSMTAKSKHLNMSCA